MASPAVLVSTQLPSQSKEEGKKQQRGTKRRNKESLLTLKFLSE